MSTYSDESKDKLVALYQEEQKTYESYLAQELKLDLTRGKPSTEQVEMVSSLGLPKALKASEFYSSDGSDLRNYGQLYGISEAREFFGKLLRISAKQVMVQNNSSLTLMYDAFTRAMLFPLPGTDKVWGKDGQFKVLCPSPGYDRHFAIAEALGAELITVPMKEDGPDMDVVEELVKDHTVKAMFCVPVYSNPEGTVYSEAVCKRLAGMQTAPDFRIFWDNAYFLHHLDWEDAQAVPEVLGLAEEAGHPNRFLVFASTSKITFAGGGISCIAVSEADFAWIDSSLKLQTIGPDKVNQMQHIQFFSKIGGIDVLMRKHAELIRPKFEAVLSILSEGLEGSGLASWSRPKGGYFISLDLLPGQAKKVVSMAKAAGVALTPAGSTYPNKNDPEDKNIRIAPTFPSSNDLALAMKVVVNCVKLSALESKLQQ